MITVAKTAPADFSSIQSAVNSIQDQTSPEIILIKSGTYEEKLEINRPNLTLRGEDVETTILTLGHGAYDILENGEKRGTFRSYTLFVNGNNTTVENLTIQNSAGDGHIAGQAIAVYADADMLTFRDCCLLGHQDTLFTGPLPPSEIIPGGFKGPKEYAPRTNGRQFYDSCYIEGTIDFIFGSATAYFENCEIHSRKLPDGESGYVTAPSTPKGQKYGYVFNCCNFTSDCHSETVYLGRPWRNFAKAVFIDCELGAHIKKEGFHDWDKTESHETAFFAEYLNYGPGAKHAERPDWVQHLTEEEAKEYTRNNILNTSI